MVYDTLGGGRGSCLVAYNPGGSCLSNSIRGSLLAGPRTGNARPRKFASDRVSKPVSLRLDRGLSNLRTPSLANSVTRHQMGFRSPG